MQETWKLEVNFNFPYGLDQLTKSRLFKWHYMIYYWSSASQSASNAAPSSATKESHYAHVPPHTSMTYIILILHTDKKVLV